MLITQLKPKDEIASLTVGKTVIISCEGCAEVYFPAAGAAEAQKELLDSGAALAVVTADYVCGVENLESRTRQYIDIIESADSLLVFCCGVGAQVIAEWARGKPVFTACETLSLPGPQGVTPMEFDCTQCGECHLNETGGICPITACSKSLINGPCGGGRNGKCEIDMEKTCGWEQIYKRLGVSGGALPGIVKIRNYAPQA